MIIDVLVAPCKLLSPLDQALLFQNLNHYQVTNPPLFYDYPIRTHRTTINNPDVDGIWFYNLQLGIQGHDNFIRYCATSALDTFADIQRRGLKDEHNNPYTFFIITPYIKVMEMLLAIAKERNITRQDCDYHL